MIVPYRMTPVGEILLELVRREGPIPFRRFMELALYHPEHGYYCCGRDPFGRAGDYFTAEQLQPVFGQLIAAVIRRYFQELGQPEDFTVVELGAGRAEMAEAFAGWRYIPLEVGSGQMPSSFSGVVFANEFFDALPVDVAERRGGRWRLMRVDYHAGRFVWVIGEEAGGEISEYLERFVPASEEGVRVEIHLDALGWLERIARHLSSGYLLVIDYGYTAREYPRFPRGTLMSYRRHQASEDVLAEPGERDITALVPFSVLEQYGAACGLEPVRLDRLARLLVEACEEEGFARLLSAASQAEQLRRRLQLKTLLCGFGESFRALIARKRERQESKNANEKGPDHVGA